ncbi:MULTISPECIES: hypothetical protein [Bacillales]|jgi:hypothetical protein|uniref:DUF1737 domain-containing protein n=1 Tax=Brevibacillus aydinogluensis TaxID=927786 RepID=A0AA48M9U3_9BACL|nr:MULTISPECIES: hypothetical protein [Bacillales]REK64592.1 MAG: hypothetical protein DF221_07825 [Brevibacillus sp.]MBR8659368.1 hypothetical protein [Brevibacillus sp. NL20B1]MDT3414470.1 hypothetical protein [Brevibacillus aydinogluensis]NNV02520.1 hypothetical protein [Brevibacillus sp. MCWH]UFJ60054.1 hypothetical protein IRT44_12090 [Anoxybacillus sediminis]
MKAVKNITFYFSGGESVTIRSSEPEEIVQMIANLSDGWLQYDDIVINVQNISYLRITDAQ